MSEEDIMGKISAKEDKINALQAKLKANRAEKKLQIRGFKRDIKSLRKQLILQKAKAKRAAGKGIKEIKYPRSEEKKEKEILQ